MMRTLFRAVTFAGPILIITGSALLPMPLGWSVFGMVMGLLIFQLALVGSFEGWMPNQRRYLELREETDRLLGLVRDLNAAALEARRAGIEPQRYVEPIVVQLHLTVDRLPGVAGIDIRSSRQGTGVSPTN